MVLLGVVDACGPSSHSICSASRPGAAQVLSATTATPPSGAGTSPAACCLDLDDLHDAGNRRCRRAVHGLDLAPDHGRPRITAYLPGQVLHVGAVDRLAGGDVVQVVDLHLALADVAEILLVLERNGSAVGLEYRSAGTSISITAWARSSAPACGRTPVSTSWLTAFTSAASTFHCLAAACCSISRIAAPITPHRLDMVAHAARAVVSGCRTSPRRPAPGRSSPRPVRPPSRRR